MAEASMEDRPPINRFFCHKCNIHFQNATSNFTCPHCSHGFIEELDVQVLDDVGRIGMDLADDLTSSDDEVLQMMNFSDLEHLISSRLPRAARSHWPRPIRRNNSGSSSSSGTANTQAHHSNRRRRYAEFRLNGVRNNRSRIFRWPVNSRQSNPQPQQQQQQQQQQQAYGQSPFEHLIQEFIFNLSGAGWTTDFTTNPHHTHHHNMHLLLPGNPGDYAWGREGLDAIVTQLLNQMDSSGPPPLQTEAIQALPVVPVTEEQVAAKLQCSVCWEDFKLDEQVKLLPCQHQYHDGCIVPWLTLHGTCPICRKVLQMGGGGVGDDGQVYTNSEPHEANSANGNSTFNTLQQLFHAVHGASSNNDVTTTTTTSSSTSPNSSYQSNSSQQQNDDGTD